ncbi:hypothetical protein [Methanooceanicella nereidis]|uniref:hypothetical protein n=1 Tax=Methanooceanicella nereidis TaxID=2052831 RepID=UPI001E59CB31|nr:hypothetical protein [Methanocella sp. CWC-04]
MLLKDTLSVEVTSHVIFKVMCLVLALWAANILYGYVHECAHAVIVKAFEGQVYGIYVNYFGLDASTTHTAIKDDSGMILLYMAGLAMTTVLAFATLLIDAGPVTLFIAVRTSLYALNYTPGTDVSLLYSLIGSSSYLISVGLIALNLTCAALCITYMFNDQALSGPSSSLLRGLLSHNSLK